MDFKIDGTNDIVYDMETNNLAMVSSKDALIQAVKLNLETRKGEYELNQNEGLDWNVIFVDKGLFDRDRCIDAVAQVLNSFDIPITVNSIDMPDQIPADRKFTITVDMNAGDENVIVEVGAL